MDLEEDVPWVVAASVSRKEVKRTDEPPWLDSLTTAHGPGRETDFILKTHWEVRSELGMAWSSQPTKLDVEDPAMAS